MRTLFRVPLLLLLLGSTSSCRQNHSTAASNNTSSVPPAQYHFQPTATEAFHLRDECKTLAQKLLEEDSHGDAVSVEARSNFDLDSDRCYVELDSTTYDASKPNFGRPDHITETDRYLYDGQTKELLAFFKKTPQPNDPGGGMVFVEHKNVSNPNAGTSAEPGTEEHVKQLEADDSYDVEAFINRLMGDNLPR